MYKINSYIVLHVYFLVVPEERVIHDVGQPLKHIDVQLNMVFNLNLVLSANLYNVYKHLFK